MLYLLKKKCYKYSIISLLIYFFKLNNKIFKLNLNFLWQKYFDDLINKIITDILFCEIIKWLQILFLN